MSDGCSSACWNGNDVNDVVTNGARCVPSAWTQERKWNQGTIPHGLPGG